jgi:Tol biopolymer transport system component
MQGRSRIRSLGRPVAVGFAALALTASGADARTGTRGVSAPRLLYTSQWSGHSQAYAIDPVTRRLAQVTAVRVADCERRAFVCGVSLVAPSPNGRSLLYKVASTTPAVYVANANGDRPRRLPVPWSAGYVPADAWSPDSSAIAYTDSGGVYVVRRDGSSDRLIGAGASPKWSPRGDALAYVRDRTALVVARGSAQTVVVTDASCCIGAFAWSPNGKWLAVAGGSVVTLVRTDGSDAHALANATARALSWSRAGRHLAFAGPDGLTLADSATGTLQTIVPPTYSPIVFAWSPRGTQLAYTVDNVLSVTAPGAEPRRLADVTGYISLFWAPDARSIAVAELFNQLELVSLSGATRTLLRVGDPTVVPQSFGRDVSTDFITVVGWTQPPRRPHYHRLQPLQRATVEPAALTAPWPVDQLAADGHAVAYAACGRIFVWTPSTRALVTADGQSSLAPNCTNANYRLFDLALAGERVMFGETEGGIGRSAWLTLGDYETPSAPVVLDRTNGTGPSFPRELGQFAGSGGLLLYGSWTNDFRTTPPTVTSEAIHRVDVNGCPCPVVAQRDDGPLVPLDADGTRIVASRGDELDVLSDTGTTLARVHVAATDAALAGDDLVAAVGAELRDYDAATGMLRHTWPLPGAAGARCRRLSCFASPDLTLQDAARGLAVYVAAGVAHVVRLDSGTETFNAPATAARFFDDGLVLASGSELQVVPFSLVGAGVAGRG